MKEQLDINQLSDEDTKTTVLQRAPALSLPQITDRTPEIVPRAHCLDSGVAEPIKWPNTPSGF